MNENLELLIVIINYKTASLVIDCLKTLIPQLSESHRAVVVDNDSNDGSADLIEQWVKSTKSSRQVNVVRSPVNGGFSAGNNLGMKTNSAKYYLLLNSDTLLREHAIERLLAAAEVNPSAGLVSPKLEWPSEEGQISCFRFHTPASELIASAGISLVTKILSRWDVPLPLRNDYSHPEWTSFACVLLRSEMVESIGEMDEGYFLYYEDVDYCMRAKKSGWSILNVPDARVVHLRGGSSDVKSNIAKKARLPKYYYASRTRYFTLHYGAHGFIFANLLWHLGRLISLFAEVLGKEESPVCEKQYRDIWCHFLNPLRPWSKNHECAK